MPCLVFMVLWILTYYQCINDNLGWHCAEIIRRLNQSSRKLSIRVRIRTIQLRVYDYHLIFLCSSTCTRVRFVHACILERRREPETSVHRCSSTTTVSVLRIVSCGSSPFQWKAKVNKYSLPACLWFNKPFSTTVSFSLCTISYRN